MAQAATCSPAAGENKCAQAGNPINVITGNKFQREVDLAPLPGVMGLEIIRYYNSASSGIHHRTGILGRGWRLSYEVSLAPVGDTIQVLDADGTRLVFARDPLHPSLCASTDPANGSIEIRRTRDGDEYVWSKNDGHRLSFNRQGRLVQVLASTGEFVTMQHDARGWLVRVTDPQGRSMQLNYLDKQALAGGPRFRGVQRIDTPVGSFDYRYGSASPPGANVADRHDLLANLVTVSLPDGGRRQYHYEDARFPTLLTGISLLADGPKGKPLLQRYSSYGYDDNGKAVMSTHAGGVGKITLDTTVGGRTVLTNSVGQQTVYRYAFIAGQQRLTEVRGAGCSQCGEMNVRYGYDALGRTTSVTKLDRAGVAWQGESIRYDYYGRPIALHKVPYVHGKPGPSTLAARFEYGPGPSANPILAARPSIVAGKERQVRIVYNARGQALLRTDTGWAPGDKSSPPRPIARTTRFAYSLINGRSVLTEINGPLADGPTGTPADADVTRVEWTPDGTRVNAIVAPGNARSAILYDGAGRIVGTRDDDGSRLRLARDSQGRITDVERDGEHRWTKYDPAGRAVEQGTGSGPDARPQRRFAYDAAGRTVWIASALGILERTDYDTEDRPVKSWRRSGHISREQTLRYDGFGRPIEVADAGGVIGSVAWNPRDLPTATRDALGRETRFDYDGGGVLQSITPAANAAWLPPSGRRVAYGADAEGHTASVKAGDGATTRYERDDFGRVVATTSDDSGRTTFRYDAGSRLLRACDADGACMAYEYDVSGHLVRRIASRGKESATTLWRYAGTRLVGIDDAAQSERYEHDVDGKLIRRTVTLHLAGGGHIEHATSYVYDRSGRLASRSLPDGSILLYRRNGQGQVIALERTSVLTGWLRWMAPRQTIVGDLERDLVGLRRLRYGNGVEGSYLRSPDGSLARIVYRATPGADRTRIREALLGVGPVRAAQAVRRTGAGWAANAFIDRRYWWDRNRNLLATTEPGRSDAYAYDPQDRLIAAQPRIDGGPAQEAAYYLVDGIGNRLLGREEGKTVRSTYLAQSSRLAASGPNGRDLGAPETPSSGGAGQRYIWNVAGQLAEVWNGDDRIAVYRYDARGDRVEKRTREGTRRYLYEGGELSAELDPEGRILRQYVNLAGMPVAVIDSASPGMSRGAAAGTAAQILEDIASAIRSWFGSASRIAYLHSNHLGAPEAVTDQNGKLVWSATYQPFGRATPSEPAGYGLNLRLPGQYADVETGLHYNHHRYYNPESGRYISPDPLGLRGGINSFSYANGNPLKFVDPSGLLLFAFDGTGNSSDPAPGSGNATSNVYHMYDAYSGDKYYITGIGTTNNDMQVEGSVYSGSGFAERLALAFKFLNQYIAKNTDTGNLVIDVVGFSRGAAEARAWLNQLSDMLSNGEYVTNGKSRCISFNFAGLFDTVPHLGLFHEDEKNYVFSIPAAVKIAAHAMALNEYRGGAADFDGWSILKNAAQDDDPSRIEQSFLGAHSDIGGGFEIGDLSDIAFMWMIEQAKAAGLTFNSKTIVANGWDVVTNPVIHDKSSNLINGEAEGGPGKWTEDRDIHYGDGSTVPQRGRADASDMRYADTVHFISYLANPNSRDNIAGTVDVKAYCTWLNSKNYFKDASICK